MGDAERDAVLDELAEHYTAGRLWTDEFNRRTEAAMGARTARELAELMADLPTTPTRSTLHHPAFAATETTSRPAPPSNVGRVVLDLVVGIIIAMALVCTVGLIAVAPNVAGLTALLGAIGGGTVVAGSCFLARGRL